MAGLSLVIFAGLDPFKLKKIPPRGPCPSSLIPEPSTKAQFRDETSPGINGRPWRINSAFPIPQAIPSTKSTIHLREGRWHECITSYS